MIADTLIDFAPLPWTPVLTKARREWGLAEGHLFRVDDDVWALAEAPVAEDDGRWWAVEVEP